LDPQDQDYDRRLAKHLISLFDRSDKEEENEHLDMGLLKDYLGYARATFHPVLTPEAEKYLKHAYVEMRKIGSSRGQITAYPRQLESLIRLAEAHAKMRFKNLVELEDVEEARRLHREALKQSAIDPSSGKIDISILTTGMSMTNRKRREEIISGLKQLLQQMHADRSMSQDHDQSDQLGQIGLNYQNVFIEFKNSSNWMITREMFDDAIKQLRDDGFITVMGNKSIRLCS